MVPVNDAFHETSECPLCYMRHKLETSAVDFTMGSSYMEDDVRAETDKIGFCTNHVQMLYNTQNRLGLALILKTHMDKTIKDIEQSVSSTKKLSAPSIFRKKQLSSEVPTYIKQLDASCYICDKINRSFERYIVTLFWLYKNDSEFQNKFRRSNGFCTSHYGLLFEDAPKYLSAYHLDNFISDLNKLYLENMKRVRDDLSWFIDKFDYRYVNEPWKTSKDALPRAMNKINGLWPE